MEEQINTCDSLGYLITAACDVGVISITPTSHALVPNMLSWLRGASVRNSKLYTSLYVLTAKIISGAILPPVCVFSTYILKGCERSKGLEDRCKANRIYDINDKLHVGQTSNAHFDLISCILVPRNFSSRFVRQHVKSCVCMHTNTHIHICV